MGDMLSLEPLDSLDSCLLDEGPLPAAVQRPQKTDKNQSASHDIPSNYLCMSLRKPKSYPFINVSCAGMSLKLIFENWITELSEAWFLSLLTGWSGSLSTGRNYPLHCCGPARLPPVPTSSRANMTSHVLPVISMPYCLLSTL